MYAGEVVESGTTRDVFRNPDHPYTRKLLECDPARIAEATRNLPVIGGTLPDLVDLPGGCVFRPRCDRSPSIFASLSDPLCVAAITVPPVTWPGNERPAPGKGPACPLPTGRWLCRDAQRQKALIRGCCAWRFIEYQARGDPGGGRRKRIGQNHVGPGPVWTGTRAEWRGHFDGAFYCPWVRISTYNPIANASH